VSFVVNFCLFRGNVRVLGPSSLPSQESAHECGESAGGITDASGSKSDHNQAWRGSDSQQAWAVHPRSSKQQSLAASPALNRVGRARFRFMR
jgi:hypothetical protein